MSSSVPIIRTESSHKVWKYRDQRFWAEGGRICVVDDQTGASRVLAISEFEDRAASFKASLARSTDLDERRDWRSLLHSVESCIDEARRQGDETDPEVLAEKIRQKTGRRTIVAPAYYPSVGVPNMPVSASASRRVRIQ